MPNTVCQLKVQEMGHCAIAVTKFI